MIVEHRFAHIPQDARRGRAWIASLAPLMEVRLAPAAQVPVDAFHRHHHLGMMILGEFESPAQITERSEAFVARQALDHLVLRTQIRGQARIDVGEPVGVSRPGDIVLFDLAHPIRIEVEPAAGVELVLPRRVLADGIPVRHGRILEGDRHPLTRLLADHLRNLPACLPTAGQAADLGAATLALCRAVIAQTAERASDRPADPISITIRHFIEANLATIDVPLLTSRFGLSQRSLYRLFPGEGVSSFIRDRRLAHAMRELARIPTGGRSMKLARLAHECGFANPRVFSRAFHRKYGIWPADVPANGCPSDEGGGTSVPLSWLHAL